MTQTVVKKLGDLVHTDSFTQVNFIKGYKYIDKAGEVVNLFYDETEAPPPFKMDQASLTIRTRQKTDEEWRLSISDFWMHKISPSGLDVVASSYEKMVGNVLSIVDVVNINRLGWRNRFVYECNKVPLEKLRYSAILARPGLELGELVFTANISDFAFNFRVLSVVKENEPEGKGLLYDVDCFRNYKTGLSVDKVKWELKKMRETMQSTNFLDVLNFFIQK